MTTRMTKEREAEIRDRGRHAKLRSDDHKHNCNTTLRQYCELELILAYEEMVPELLAEIDALRENLVKTHSGREICPACATEFEKGSMQICGESSIKELVQLRSDNLRMRVALETTRLAMLEILDDIAELRESIAAEAK